MTYDNKCTPACTLPFCCCRPPSYTSKHAGSHWLTLMAHHFMILSSRTFAMWVTPSWPTQGRACAARAASAQMDHKAADHVPLFQAPGGSMLSKVRIAYALPSMHVLGDTSDYAVQC